jgi:hypothetical protein
MAPSATRQIETAGGMSSKPNQGYSAWRKLRKPAEVKDVHGTIQKRRWAMFSNSIDTSYREKDQVSLVVRLIGLALFIFICPLFFFIQFAFAEIKVIKTEPFTITDDAVNNGLMFVKADWDSVNNRFLAVWNKNWDITGQLINPDGTLYGDRFPIVMSTGAQQWPSAVIFDPEHQRYLVAYTSNSPCWLTYCQFVNADGSLQGEPFLVVDSWQCTPDSPNRCYQCGEASLKRDPVNHRFVALLNIGNLHMGFLSLEGGSIPRSSLVPVTNFPSGQGSDYQDFAFDAHNNRFLVAYRGNDSAYIVGLLLDSSGNVIKKIPQMSAYQANWPIVGFNPRTQEYLVGYLADRGQRVSSDGALIGTEIDLSPTGWSDQYGMVASIGFDEATQKFLVFVYRGGGAPNTCGLLVDGDGTVQRPCLDLSSFVMWPVAGGSANIGYLFAWMPDLDGHDIAGGFARFDTGIPLVTITAPDPIASEAGKSTACFKISRTGSAATRLSVSYKLSGTAKNGKDYNRIASSVAIPVGKSSVTVKITPRDAAKNDGDKTVNLKFLPRNHYTVASPDNATITIKDDDD